MMLDIAAMHCALERGKKTINIKDWEFAMQIVARSIASQKILVGSGGV
jgi:histone H3/H4